MTWESVLEICSVEFRDYGIYACIAQNALGTVTHELLLEKGAFPDPPTDLKILDFTHNTVTIAWVPGFNGGLQQSYKIRYTKVDSRFYRYEDVFPENETSFTITMLASGAEFAFSVQAINSIGASNFTQSILQKTLGIIFAFFGKKYSDLGLFLDHQLVFPFFANGMI